MLPRGRLATILPDVEAEERTLRAPEAVVTVPAMEALFAACAAHGVPAIAAMGRKGGSTVAAAVCNALVYSAAEMLDPAARGWK